MAGKLAHERLLVVLWWGRTCDFTTTTQRREWGEVQLSWP